MSQCQLTGCRPTARNDIALAEWAFLVNLIFTYPPDGASSGTSLRPRCIPTNRTASSLSRDDSGLLTSVRTGEARFVNLSSQATVVVRQQHPAILVRGLRQSSSASNGTPTVIHVRGRGASLSFLAVRRTASYSCRRAATGSMRDARLAGA